MNFQTNKRLPIRAVQQISISLCPSARIKTCITDISDDDSRLKRFQRSQVRINQPINSNTSIVHKIQNNKRQQKQKHMDNSKCSEDQVFISNSRIFQSKFIPNTMRDLNCKDNNMITSSKISNRENIHENQVQNSRLKESKLQFTNFEQPFKNKNNHSFNQLKLKIKNIQKSEIRQQKSYSTVPQKSRPHLLKNMFQNYNSPSMMHHKTNLSTQQSLKQDRKPKKLMTAGSQTQSFKSSSIGCNTIFLKSISIKTQTTDTFEALQKTVQQLNAKLKIVKQQNQRMKGQLMNLKKQKQEYAKQIKQLIPNKQNTKVGITSNSRSQRSLSVVSQNQSYKQISLQNSVQNLKKQIESLKAGTSIKTVEEMLENIKAENSILLNQIQTISLRCRMLQQQNNQYSLYDQQNRKLKTQLKYLRGSLKDSHMQIDRLKKQIKKLREQPKIAIRKNVIQDSRMYSGWGSETDSLNLSTSFIRD